MKTFTEAEIAAIEEDSRARFDGRVMPVELPEFDGLVIVAPFDRKGYAAYYDEEVKNPQTAHRYALFNRLLWPGLGEIEALRQACAMMPEHVTKQLEIEAARRGPMSMIAPLDLAKLPPGLTIGMAEELIKAAKGARLWSVDNPAAGLSCVMRAPSSDTWLASRTLVDDAVAKLSGIIASFENFVLTSVVWSASPLTASEPGAGAGLLDLKPGLIWDLRAAYLRMGGDGAAVRRKSLRDYLVRDPGGASTAL